MTIATNSYGSVAEVAALARRYTSNGSFSTTTIPSESQVEKFIDRISGICNVLLAEAGFKVPITQADAKLMIDEFVVEAVADLCHYANGSGRFYSDRAIDSGRAPSSIIRTEFAAWIEEHAEGLEKIGATRTVSTIGMILTKKTDSAGSEIDPLFKRTGFAGSNNSLGDE